MMTLACSSVNPSSTNPATVAFSVSGPPSDAFKSDQRSARYRYNDSGKRYEFTIDAAGTIVAKEPNGRLTPLTAGWSYTKSRLGTSVIPPAFDLIDLRQRRDVAVPLQQHGNQQRCDDDAEKI